MPTGDTKDGSAKAGADDRCDDGRLETFGSEPGGTSSCAPPLLLSGVASLGAGGEAGGGVSGRKVYVVLRYQPARSVREVRAGLMMTTSP